MSLPAMLFAAGFGTRMGALTKDTPKPLLQAGGTTLIDHALGMVEAAGCAPIVANTHYHAQKLEAHLGTRALISREEPDILDSGGGLKAAGRHLGAGPVATLNADTVWLGPNPIRQLLDAWEPGEMDCLMLLTPVTQARAYSRAGDFFLGEDASPARRGEEPSAPFIYSGAQIIKMAALESFDEPIFSLNAVWDLLNASGRLKAVTYGGIWVDVGTAEGLAIADQTLKSGA